MADAGTDKTGEQDKDKKTPTPGVDDKGVQDKQGGDVQKAIDAIVARERKDADAKLAQKDQELANLRAEIEKLKPGKKDGDKKDDADPSYIESIRKPLVEENERLKSELETRNAVTKRSALEAAAKAFAVDGAEKDVAEALLARVKIGANGALEVVDAQGRTEYGAKGPKTVDELVREHFKAKPYLAKATVRDGLGLADPQRGTRAGETIESLKAQIAEHDAKKEFGKSAPLKERLRILAERQGANR